MSSQKVEFKWVHLEAYPGRSGKLSRDISHDLKDDTLHSYDKLCYSKLLRFSNSEVLDVETRSLTFWLELTIDPWKYKSPLVEQRRLLTSIASSCYRVAGASKISTVEVYFDPGRRVSVTITFLIRDGYGPSDEKLTKFLYESIQKLYKDIIPLDESSI